jgi:hypothetical protein
MVSKRRSPRKRAQSTEDKAEHNETSPSQSQQQQVEKEAVSTKTPSEKKSNGDEHDEDLDKVEVTTPSRKRKKTPSKDFAAKDKNSAVKSVTKSPTTRTTTEPMKKHHRHQQKENLKSKNTGVGLKISVDSASANKKIIFDNDATTSLEEQEKDDVLKSSETVVHQRNDEENELDEDVVEEVQGRKARNELMSEWKAQEQEVLKAKKKKKRKERKPKEPEKGDEELDDAFFSQLETIREEQAKEAATRAVSKRKHTTFVFSQDHDDNDKQSSGNGVPVKVDGNINVVVLGTAATSSLSSICAATANVVSNEALLYSRSCLVSGYDVDSVEVQHQNDNKKLSQKRKMRQGETTPWKRSKTSVSLIRRKDGKGRPAVFFIRKQR